MTDFIDDARATILTAIMRADTADADKANRRLNNSAIVAVQTLHGEIERLRAILDATTLAGVLTGSSRP